MNCAKCGAALGADPYGYTVNGQQLCFLCYPPVTTSGTTITVTPEPISRRDYFAGLMAQKFMNALTISPTKLAEYACNYADALIAELDKPKENL